MLSKSKPEVWPLCNRTYFEKKTPHSQIPLGLLKSIFLRPLWFYMNDKTSVFLHYYVHVSSSLPFFFNHLTI